MGGRIAAAAPVERYDTAKDSWIKIGEMPSPRQRFAAATVEGTIIVVGGEESPQTTLRYDPACEKSVPGSVQQ